jgi:hypothetical protein
LEIGRCSIALSSVCIEVFFKVVEKPLSTCPELRCGRLERSEGLTAKLRIAV